MIHIKDKLNKIPKGVKASVAFFLSSVVTSGLSYFITPFYTRLLTPDEYGQVSVFYTWMSIFGIFATFNLSAGVFNNGMLDFPDKRDEYSLSMLVLSNIISICFFSVFLCIYPFIKDWIDLDIPLILLMGVVLFFRPAYSFWTSRNKYELKYKGVFLITVLSSILSPLVAIVCVLIFKDDRLYARLFGAELTLAVIYICFYIFLLVKGRFKIVTKYWKAALLFNLPLIPHYLSMYLLGSSDKLMISMLVNNEAVAYYSIAYSVSSVALIIWSAANSTLIPYTYENCKNENYGAISKVAIPILMIFAVACILVIMLAPEVVAVMGTEGYREVIYAIPPIVGGIFFQVHYSLYANILFYYKKTKFITLSTVTATVLNLVLNYIFIGKYGYIAAGYTTFICYLVKSIIDYSVMKKIVKTNIYNMKHIGLLSLGVIVVSLLSNFIYDYFVVRYVIIAVFLIILILFRKKIMAVFKTMKK